MRFDDQEKYYFSFHSDGVPYNPSEGDLAFLVEPYLGYLAHGLLITRGSDLWHLLINATFERHLFRINCSNSGDSAALFSTPLGIFGDFCRRHKFRVILEMGRARFSELPQTAKMGPTGDWPHWLDAPRGGLIS